MTYVRGRISRTGLPETEAEPELAAV
jgi:hypothetical protein